MGGLRRLLRRAPRWWAASAVTRPEHVLPFAWMALIYGLSSIPDVSPEILGPESWVDRLVGWLQNLLHVPLYGVLALLWLRVLRAWRIAGGALAPGVFALTVGYGALDEWHQSFVPGRDPSSGDVLLDAAGATLAIVFDAWARRRHGRAQSP